MKIPEIKIEEIRSSADIIDIISGYVQLKKRGKNFIGLCPFHQEKTPSFVVSGDKQIFHCFGCHAGGNAFKFLMEYKNISFVESVQEIAATLGITLEYEKGKYDKRISEQEELYDINVLAAKFFHKNLQDSGQGEFARNYLKDRNIKPATLKAFGIGFAPDSWEYFVHYLKESDIELNKAKQIGLVDTRDDGSFYDKLRGRVIFPIFSPNGRVIAFGGRILDNSQKAAKYLNSPESIIYSKRNSLYGLYHSKEEIRKYDKALLVEGYMDTIALFQQGVKNVVASSGTALTEEQVQLLSRFTKNILVMFDADPAGQQASLRSIEVLLKYDFEVSLLTLPNGEDPDSFINKNGKEAFEEETKKAKNFLEFQATQFEANGMFEDPNEQTKAIRELVKSVSFVNDKLKRNILIKTISKKFNLREKLIESELESFLSSSKNTKDRKEQRKIEQALREKVEKAAAVQQSEADLKFESEVITLLFEGLDVIIDHIFDHILPDDFRNDDYKQIAQVVYDNFLKDHYDPAYFIDQIEDQQLVNIVMSLSLHDEIISRRHGEDYIGDEKLKNDKIKHAYGIVKKFQLTRIDEQLHNINTSISAIEDDNEIIEALSLLKDLQEEKKILLGISNEE